MTSQSLLPSEVHCSSTIPRTPRDRVVVRTRWARAPRHGGTSRSGGGDEVIERTELAVRTRHVLGLAGAGMTNGEIAAHLGVSQHEVDRHVREAIRALSARSRLEAAVLA